MIYVCSDIHGQYELYKKMLEKINFSDNDTLYILGDAIDRGPDSMSLLLDIMKRKNVVLLLGNHELMMINYLKMIDKRTDCWFLSANKGKQTFKEFEALSKNEQDDIIDFLSKLPLQVQIELNNKKFLLSHSFYIKDTGTISNWQDVHYYVAMDVVWASPWRKQEDFVPKRAYYMDDTIHVIGHVPVLSILEMWNDGKPVIEPYISERIINIDLGCAYMEENFKGKPKDLALGCINLNDFAQDKHTFIKITKEI